MTVFKKAGKFFFTIVFPLIGLFLVGLFAKNYPEAFAIFFSASILLVVSVIMVGLKIEQVLKLRNVSVIKVVQK